MLHCFDKLVGLPALPPGCQHYDYDDYDEDDDDDDDGDVDDDDDDDHITSLFS